MKDGGMAMAFFIAFGVTFLDIEKVFFIPKEVKKKVYAIVITYCSIHGSLAASIYHFWHGQSVFEGWAPSLVGAALGLTYLSLLRLKFMNFVDDSNSSGPISVPIGVELVYDSFKAFTYRKIQHIASTASMEMIKEHIKERSLEELYDDVQIKLMSDNITPDDEMERNKEKFRQVFEDGQQSESQIPYKAVFAKYLLTDRISFQAKSGKKIRKDADKL